MRLLITLGAQRENLYMIDRKGVIHRDRDDLNQYKAMFAVDTSTPWRMPARVRMCSWGCQVPYC